MVESPEKRSLTDILAEERQRSLELESKMKSALKRTNAETGATDEDATVTQEDCMVPVIGFLSPTLAALAVQTAASPNTLLMQRVCRTPGKLLRIFKKVACLHCKYNFCHRPKIICSRLGQQAS